MRDIKEYTDSILVKAREEGEALRAEATRRREALLADQKGQLEQEDARKREEFSLWLDREYAQRLAHRRRAVQKELSAYRQQLMALTFEQTLEQLNGLSRERLIALFQRAVNRLREPGAYEAVFGSLTAGRIPPSAFLDAITPPPGVSITCAPEPIPGEGGFVLRSGVVEYVFLFRDMLWELREQRGSETIRRLFEQEAL